MKRVPSKFKLMGHTIKVQVISKKDWKKPDCVGEFSPETDTMTILRQSKSQTQHTFWHEATHAMLYIMGHKFYSNEAFVDQLGGLLAQIMDTAE
jgi:hypothetical protein